MDYYVFSDESSHTDGEFRSIAAISLPYISREQITALSDSLAQSIEFSEKGELKWRNIGRNGTANVCRAKAAVDFVLSNRQQGLRIDVLTWDINDSRHSVEHRDDIANYARMYFHLHRNLIKRRGDNTRWHLRPDRQVRIDWDTIQRCFSSTGTWQHNTQEIPELLTEEAREVAPYVDTFKEVDSAETPFIQLADIFAGMASYSRKNTQIIRQLLNKNSIQIKIFPPDVPAYQVSRKDHGRFQVIYHLYRCCKKQRLGVYLESKAYLLTKAPRNPINFWHYESQHPRDKAPTKNKL